MSKILRLNDETIRLLNIAKEQIKNLIDTDVNDNVAIQSALRFAIHSEIYLLDKKTIDKK